MGKYFTRPLFRLFHRKHDERSRQQSNPPVPTKPSLTLPPEMLDEILDHIPMNREGVRTLLACALVATSWAGPSQRRLFSSVDVRRGNYKWWMDGVVYSGSKDHLLKYVRSLQYSRGLDFRMRDLPWDSGEYLSALHNIHSLKFCDTRIERLDEEGFRICFSAFRETLTCLSLETFATSFNAFVTLVDYFPNLTTLRLRPFVLEPDEGPVPSLSRPLRGKLRVRDGHGDCLKFFNRFAKLDLEYEELVISSGSARFVEMALMNSALKLSANTIKFLRVTTEPEVAGAFSISDFRQLQELELVVARRESFRQILISSISSTEIRKIVFLVKCLGGWEPFARETVRDSWDMIERQLCLLVDRLHKMGYRYTLEVELRVTPGEYDFAKFLSKFRRKGIVTITDATNGDRLLHSSPDYH